MSRSLYWIIFWVYYLDACLGITHALLSPIISLTSFEWYLGLACFYLLVASCVYAYRLVTIDYGHITEDGIGLRRRNMVIAFRDIEKVIVEQGNPSCVYTNTGMQEVRLSVTDLVALAKTEFNNWAFQGRKVFITRGIPDKGFSAAYELMGKYADAGLTLIFLFMGGILLFCAIGVAPIESMFLAFGLLLIAFGLRAYKEVSVSFADDKIWYKDENLAISQIALTDVEKIEKSLMRTKVVARDGTTMFLPRALFLVPELLAGFSGVRII